MVKLVLFDIDGTLVHTGGAGIKAFAKAFALEFGIPNGTEKMKFAGRTDVGLVREFFRLNNIEPDAETLPALLRELRLLVWITFWRTAKPKSARASGN